MKSRKYPYRHLLIPGGMAVFVLDLPHTMSVRRSSVSTEASSNSGSRGEDVSI